MNHGDGVFGSFSVPGGWWSRSNERYENDQWPDIRIDERTRDVAEDFFGEDRDRTEHNKCTTYVVDKGTELGNMIEMYQSVDVSDQKRIIGYMQALMDMKK